jgi:hypothetical protein
VITIAFIGNNNNHHHHLHFSTTTSPTKKILKKKKRVGVNFTNILRAAFSYESFARSFFVLEVKVKLFIGAKKMAHLL